MTRLELHQYYLEFADEIYDRNRRNQNMPDWDRYVRFLRSYKGVNEPWTPTELKNYIRSNIRREQELVG